RTPNCQRQQVCGIVAANLQHPALRRPRPRHAKQRRHYAHPIRMRLRVWPAWIISDVVRIGSGGWTVQGLAIILRIYSQPKAGSKGATGHAWDQNSLAPEVTYPAQSTCGLLG